jgi:hypothetical protein
MMIRQLVLLALTLFSSAVFGKTLTLTQKQMDARVASEHVTAT